jgi:hypothetical protein
MSAASSLGTGALLATLLVGACSDGPTEAGPQGGAARLSVQATFAGGAGGGPGEAFDRADRLFVRALGGTEVRFEQEMPFDPGVAETIVLIDVPLRELAETLLIDLELRVGTEPIFSGSAMAELSIGVGTDVGITLVPVVAGVVCSGDMIVLSSYGATATIPGYALFATGDSIPEVPVGWATADVDIVSVSQAGVVTALQDGDAVVTCRAGESNFDTRIVRVFAVVASVEVAPPEATVQVGRTVAFTAMLRDALGNIITAPRPLAWSSGDETIAVVDEAGIATGVGAGTVSITATSGAPAGSSLLTVVFPPPVVTTVAASDVTGSGAVLNAVVNPNGAPTEAWFEWSISVTTQSTPVQQIGSGTTDVAVSVPLADLQPDVTYFFRAVARSDGGRVNGQIFSFTTLRPPTVNTTGATLDAQPEGLCTDAGCPLVLTADLSATVNPHGTPTQAGFEWGTSSTLAQSTRTAPQDVGSGTAATPFTQTVGPLATSTTYFARAFAESAGGSTLGNIISFTTPAGAVETITGTSGWTEQTINDVRRWTASMNGQVMPNGGAATAWIEYSLDQTLASFERTAEVQIPASSDPTAFNGQFSVTTGPDDPAPTYFYRAAASNVFGTVRGEIQIVGFSGLR